MDYAVIAIASLHAQLIVDLSVDEPSDAVRALGALASIPTLVPTHWGPARGLRDPFSIESVRQAISSAAAANGELVPEFRRFQNLDIAVGWYRAGNPLSSIEVESADSITPHSAAQFFHAITQLAGLMPVDFGAIDIRWTGQDPDTYLAKGPHGQHLGGYCDWGVQRVFARNFVGPRLLRLIEVDSDAPMITKQFLSAFAASERLAGGILVADLVAVPWDSNPVALKAAQAKAHEAWQAVGLLARTSDGVNYQPARRWKRPVAHSAR